MRLEGDTIVVRPLSAAELPTLLQIYSGTPLYFDALGIKTTDLTLAEVRNQWAAVQANPQRYLFGVEVPAVNLLIGVVDIELHTPAPPIATLQLLLIWGGFQRQGYAQEVMELVEAWLVAHQAIDELQVVAAANDDGVRFWRLRGYTQSGAVAPTPFRGIHGMVLRRA